jgi:hypothetical protein
MTWVQKRIKEECWRTNRFGEIRARTIGHIKMSVREKGCFFARYMCVRMISGFGIYFPYQYMQRLEHKRGPESPDPSMNPRFKSAILADCRDMLAIKPWIALWLTLLCCAARHWLHRGCPFGTRLAAQPRMQPVNTRPKLQPWPHLLQSSTSHRDIIDLSCALCVKVVRLPFSSAIHRRLQPLCSSFSLVWGDTRR